MRQHLRPALTLLAACTVLTGVLYPLAVTAAGQLLWPYQANGSLLWRHGRPVGSVLIGQEFTAPGYFWGRPSATVPEPYNGLAGGGRNLGPLSPALRTAVAARVRQLRQADPTNTAPVPVDLVTASASGLDPHLSLAGAEYQAPRVARARGLPLATVQDLVARCSLPRQWGLLGEPRVNVLQLNLALEAVAAGQGKTTP